MGEKIYPVSWSWVEHASTRSINITDPNEPHPKCKTKFTMMHFS